MGTKNTLISLFGKSPLRPIQEHMKVAASASSQLPIFLEACFAGDWDSAKTTRKYINEREAAADKLKKKIRRNLSRSLFLPVARGDLLELITSQDRICNRAKDVATILISRKMQVPEKLHKPLMKLTKVVDETVQQACLASQELDELLEVGFSGREVSRVERMLGEVDKLEGETDKLASKARDTLFKMETSLNAVDVIFLYDLIAVIGGIADSAESAADRLQITMAR